ncbi:FkbM family methyltransferase [Pleomorphomonas oryzae]|uniref:FkbM family methyltransferase n=1 Tax=Pleomorphomonas oryzae TaxID=261934 RepID=UPI00146E0D18|nr:FkbM family methyltransferase [Pleomorphomonas oryzae]
MKKPNQRQSKYFGLNNLDKILEEYLPFDNGFFVELGANNGVDQSNTLYFELFKGWKGVLVEPVAHNYFMCRKNRSEENSIHCNACVSFEYKDRFVPISYANLMTMPIIESSSIVDKEEYVNISRPHLEKHEDVVIFGAEAKTLNDILLESGAPKEIDFLSLDVEGAELEVLRGIDFQEFRFKYMCIECFDLEKIFSYLDEKGYEMIRKISTHDYIFRNKVLV